MNEIQPSVTIQIGQSPYVDPQLLNNSPISQEPGLYPGSSIFSQSCNSPWGGSSYQTDNSVLNTMIEKFNAVMTQMMTMFKSLIEMLVNKLQLPTTTGSTAQTPASTTTSSTPSTTTPASSSTSTPASSTQSTTSQSSSTATPSTSTTSSTTPTSSTTSTNTPSSTSNSNGTTASTGTTQNNSNIRQLGKTGQFLWKPKSDKDGKLVILIPKKFGKAKSVRVLSSDGKTLLASGKYSGMGNGDRAHYRFSKPGADFPPGSIVEIVRNNGVREQVSIPKTGSRFIR